MNNARALARVLIPRAVHQELRKASGRLGPHGVKVAKTLVAVDTGRTKSNVTYETRLTRGRSGRGWIYWLEVFVRAATKREALAAVVTEFGRGHGRAAARARGNLPPRPYLRPSRELTARRARNAFQRALRLAANKLVIQTGG